MTRAEYLAELDSHLITLPREERDMALEFYSEYFDEAGPENEQAVISELGKPYNLARSIIGETSAYNKSEVYIKYRESKPMPQNSTGVFASLRKPGAFDTQDNSDSDQSEQSFEEKIKAGLANDKNETADEKNMSHEDDAVPNGSTYRANFKIDPDAAPKYDENQHNGGGMFDQYYTHADTNADANGNYSGNYNYGDGNYNAQDKNSYSAGKILFWILMFIFIIIPIIVPVVIAVLAVAAAIAVSAVALILAAFVSIIAGIITIFSSLFEGIAIIAAGIVCAGAGMILTAVTLLFFGKFLPWLVKRIFGGKRSVA